MPRPGQRIDRYVVEHHIADGGAASVWAVRHHILGTRRALKILRRSTPRGRERLVAEGRAQASLHHPNVLPVLDLLQVDGAPALLLPLVEGPPLSRLVRHHRLSRDDAARLLAGVAAGLAHGHAHGVLHRDLKPGNILLELAAGGVVPRVADFGIALVEGASPEPSRFVGTPAYAAPEQLLAEPLDHRCDLYSLGLVAWQLVQGERPHRDREPEALRTWRPPPVSAPEWQALLDGLLAPDPRDRLDDTAAVAAAFASLVEVRRESGALTAVCARLGRSGQPSPSPSGLSALPDAPGPFLGREADLDRVGGFLLGPARLVTLVGPAGAGKTRLALAAVDRLRPVVPVAQGWVDCSGCTSEASVLAHLAATLDVPLRSDPEGEVARALRSRGPLLLLLDDLDRAVPEGVGVLGRLLDAAPELTLLATGREPLELSGEQRIEVSPLSVEPGSDGTSPAGRLFLALAPTGTRRSRSVEALVRALDGLPLAIELAAAQLPARSPAQVLASLDEGEGDVKVSDPMLLPRRRSVHAALRASWRRLSPESQSALGSLAVFEGPFSLRDAEALLQGDRGGLAPRNGAEDLLEDLARRSLLQRDSRGRRLYLLQTVRRFARYHWTPAVRAHVEGRHAAWLARLGSERAITALGWFDGARRLRALLRQRDDLEAAFTSSLERGLSTALPLGRALVALSSAYGPDVEAQVVCDRLLGSPHLDDDARDEVAVLRFRSAVFQLPPQEVLALRPPPSPQRPLRREAERLGADALRLRTGGRYQEGRRVADAAVLCAAEAGAPELQADNLLVAARLSIELGDWDRAEDEAQEALALARHAEQVPPWIRALITLAHLRRRAGAPELGLPLAREAVELAARSRPRAEAGDLLNNVALLHLAAGHPDEATDTFESALDFARSRGSVSLEATVEHNLSTLYVEADRLDEAAVANRRASLLSERVGMARLHAEAMTVEATLAFLAGEPERAIELLREAGRRRAQHGSREVAALYLSQAATIAWLAGDPDRTDTLLDEVDATLPRPTTTSDGALAHAAASSVVGLLRLEAGVPGAAEELVARAQGDELPLRLFAAFGRARAGQPGPLRATVEEVRELALGTPGRTLLVALADRLVALT